MRVLLRDLTPGQDYLMQFRSNNGTDVSPWSPIYNFRTDGDATAPSNPGSLTWVPTGESFVGSWTAPTLDGPDINGVQKALKDFKDYEVTVEANGKTKVYYTVNTAFEFTLVMNQEAFGGIELTVKITVKSRDFTGNKSSGVTLTATEDTPPTPSTPVVTNSMGQISIEWDGLTAIGAINPFNLEYIEIHASTTNNFTPADSTKIARFEGWIAGKQRTILTGLTYGTLHYFKLVSVNRKGKKSPPSGQAQGTPKRVSGLDIDSNAQLSAAQMNFTARNLGGANAFYGTTLPTGTAATDGTVYKDGDVFYNTSLPPAVDSGKTYRRSGTGWVEDTNIGVISGKKILTNTLTADAVGTNLLITSSANIGNLVVDDAKIANVNVGKIVADETKTNLVIANTANIKDAIITSAKIVNLSADKITTGSLNASEKIIAGPSSGTHAEMSGTGFRVFAEDPVDNVPNEVVRMGTETNDFIGVVSATGELLASMDDSGGINGQYLNISHDPVFQGMPLSQTISQVGGAVVARYSGSLGTDLTPVTTEIGLAEVNAVLDKTRVYEISYRYHWMGSSADEENITAFKYEFAPEADPENCPTPTIDSTNQVTSIVQSTGLINRAEAMQGSMLFEPTETSRHRFLMTARRGASSGSINVRGNRDMEFWIKDIGPKPPIVGNLSRGGGALSGGTATAAPAPKKQYYVDLAPVGSRAWNGSGGIIATNGDVYQGYHSSNGNTSGMFWYNLPNITGTVDRVDVYMYFRHWYFNSGGTVIMNISDNRGAGAGFWKARGDWYVPGWPKPGSKTVTVPGDWNAFFKGTNNNQFNGRATCITIGPGAGTNQTYYGVATDCRLRIWYTQ